MYFSLLFIENNNIICKIMRRFAQVCHKFIKKYIVKDKYLYEAIEKPILSKKPSIP